MALLPAPGEQIDRYTVLFEVARGGMAAVYAAKTNGPGGFEKVVALKTILPMLAKERRFVDMFLDEARIAARIDHPNVVHVFEVFEHGGTPVLTMELVHGRSLAEIMKSDLPPLALRLHILAHAARGVHAAHETLDGDGAPLRIVHRDVSPQNVLVGLDGQVKVTDFGVAAARGRVTHTVSGEMKGKMSYLAPEQITRELPTDRRADVWALGVVAWELLAGRKLFEGDDDAQRMYSVLGQNIPRVDSVASDVPSAVADAIALCISRDPNKRLPTAAALADVLEAHAITVGARASGVAEFMRARFGSEVERDRERVSTALSRMQTPRRSKWLIPASAAAVISLGVSATVGWQAISATQSNVEPPTQAIRAPAPPIHAAVPEVWPVNATPPVQQALPDEPAPAVRERTVRRPRVRSQRAAAPVAARGLDRNRPLPNPF